MQKPDTRVIIWGDVPAALGLLTRLPVRVDVDRAQARGAAAAWAYPLVGGVVGLLLMVLAAVLNWCGLPVAVTALLLVAAGVVVTGGLHEDGLADCADGFWGGWDRALRLEIMKDSRIGAYGVLALILGVGLRWACLTVLLIGPLWAAALILPAVISRAAMVLVMRVLPHARADGLSQSVGRPGAAATGAALMIAAVVALGMVGVQTVPLLLIGCLTVLACIAIARRKIGGQTGDVLGATQQVCEIATLITLASWV